MLLEALNARAILMAEQWPPWIRERYDVVIRLWFEVVELLGVLPLAPRWMAARRELIALQ